MSTSRRALTFAVAVFVACIVPGAARPAPPSPLVGAHLSAVQSAEIRFSEVAEGDRDGTRHLEPFRQARRGSAAPGDGAEEDLALPRQSGPSPSLAASFSALGDNGHFIPPDTAGAVGPSHLVVALNSEVRIQTRSGTVLATTSTKSFWSSLGNPEPFDPRVLYDPYGKRWIISAGGDPESSNASILLGVSRTTDPTQGWYLYRIAADTSRRSWSDYPRLGFNKTWIVVQANAFNVGDGSYVGSRVYAIDKADAYNQAGGHYTLFTDPAGATQVPATTQDPSAGTMYFVEDAAGALRVSALSGAAGSETFNAGISVALGPSGWAAAGNGDADFAPQLGTSRRIQTTDSRVGGVVYRNGSLWVTQTVFLPASGPNRASVQWWQISPGGAVLQFGRIDDPSGNTFYAFPSIAVNRYADVLIGFSRFSASSYASAGYAYRAGNDAANTLRSPGTLKSGEAPYYKTFGGPANRWGDYSATVVDPANDSSMWTIQEYAATPSGGEDRWGTWWGALNAPSWSGTPGASVSPSSITFPQLLVGQTSDPRVITLTNTGSAPLRIAGVSVTGTEFTKTSDGCTGVAIAPQGRCLVDVTFKPAAAGTRTGSVSFTDDAPGSPQVVSLVGTAVSDHTAPVSKFTTTDGQIVSGFSMVAGSTTDDVSGVVSVVVSYVDATGLVTESDPAELRCSTNHLSCTWLAGTPLVPGSYVARATGRDAAGNREASGPEVRVYVL